ncbi:MAG: phosphoribosylformylglycinamidine synthase subunit PurQ [Kocuria rhizophila]|nr:phosphoribosylformylglycinamidine synthase subunit PurQ [Kocuria rhizophila]
MVADLDQPAPDARLADVRVGVVTFPGTLDDRDAARAVDIAGGTSVPLWYADEDLQGVDAVILPGGFSYGDYLRAGAIARFAPLMGRIVDAASGDGGMPVLGICNGFQVLTEAHLLPGSMIKNEQLKFICRDQRLRVENAETSWTGRFTAGQEIVVPLKNQDGQYVADQENPSAEVRGRRPLRAARIVVSDVDGEPGWYRVNLTVRPHFKYMGADFTLSLVGKLDKE